MDAISLDYVVPSDDLASYVTLFYRFRADVPLFEDTERADHAQFRFRLKGGAADYRCAGGLLHDAPPVHLLGFTSGAIRTRAEGPLLVFGMGLTPAGWAAITRTDASQALDRVLDARALLGDVVDAAFELLSEAETAKAMAAIAEPFLRALIGDRDHATLAFTRQVDAWLAGCASPEVDALAAAAGLSRRQVERRCKALYGLAPKLLARKYRALRTATRLAAHDEEAELFLAEGFYDQSHMTRELKQFVGLTPGQIRERPGLLAQLTINQRRRLHGVVPPIISDT